MVIKVHNQTNCIDLSDVCVCLVPESSATLTNCHGYSRRSGFIAVDGCATLTMTYDFSHYVLLLLLHCM